MSDSDFTSDGGENWEGWDDTPDEPIVDLFSADVRHETPSAFLAAADARLGGSLAGFFSSLGLDVYDKIRATNTLRRAARAGVVAAEDLLAHLRATEASWRGQDDALVPAEEADPFIRYLTSCDSDADIDSDDEESGVNASSAAEAGVPPESAAAACAASAVRAKDRQIKLLSAQVAELQEVTARMSLALRDFAISAPSAAAVEASAPEPEAASAPEAAVKPPKDDVKANDAFYFSGYSKREIHEVMLRDAIRTEAYRDGIMARAEELFKDKVVLDVGCGSGILTMFAAKAGAKMCVGVDAADVIDKAREIVALNGLAGVVKLVKGKVEEVTLPAGAETVDIIISEWMGYFLLYESMLPSVLYARDKWLRRADGTSAFEKSVKAGTPYVHSPISPSDVASGAVPQLAEGSFLFPDSTRMFLSGVDTVRLRADGPGFWRDVYGFDMTPMVSATEAFPGEQVEVLAAGDACRVTDSQGLQAFDLQTVTSPELDFTSNVKLTATRDGALEAFAVWFDTIFSSKARRPTGAAPASASHKGNAPGEGDFTAAAAVRAADGSVILDTDFAEPATHWKQSIYGLVRPLPVAKGDVIDVKMVAARKGSNHRHYTVDISYKLTPGAGHAAVAEAAKEKNAGKPDVPNAEWGVAGVEYMQMYTLQ